MQEPVPGEIAPMHMSFGPWGRLLLRVSKVVAIAGGLVFVALVVMSIVSIVGRKLWSMPVPGDVEVLQMCSAFAASAFFAYCHLNGGDVKVDFFTHHWSPGKVHFLDGIGSVLVGIFGSLIAWRAGAGALSVKEAGETTMILGWPLWIAQILMVPGFVLMGVAGFYMAVLHFARAAGRAAPQEHA